MICVKKKSGQWRPCHRRCQRQKGNEKGRRRRSLKKPLGLNVRRKVQVLSFFNFQVIDLKNIYNNFFLLKPSPLLIKKPTPNAPNARLLCLKEGAFLNQALLKTPRFTNKPLSRDLSLGARLDVPFKTLRLPVAVVSSPSSLGRRCFRFHRIFSLTPSGHL